MGSHTDTGNTCSLLFHELPIMISISSRWILNPEVGAFERKYLQRILSVNRFLQMRQRKF